MINNHQSITAKSSATPRNDLFLEIDQTPEEYIPELLQIVRLFRQSVTIKQTSLKNWKMLLMKLMKVMRLKKNTEKLILKDCSSHGMNQMIKKNNKKLWKLLNL